MKALLALLLLGWAYARCAGPGYAPTQPDTSEPALVKMQQHGTTPVRGTALGIAGTAARGIGWVRSSFAHYGEHVWDWVPVALAAAVVASSMLLVGRSRQEVDLELVMKQVTEVRFLSRLSAVLRRAAVLHRSFALLLLEVPELGESSLEESTARARAAIAESFRRSGAFQSTSMLRDRRLGVLAGVESLAEAAQIAERVVVTSGRGHRPAHVSAAVLFVDIAAPDPPSPRHVLRQAQVQLDEIVRRRQQLGISVLRPNGWVMRSVGTARTTSS